MPLKNRGKCRIIGNARYAAHDLMRAELGASTPDEPCGAKNTTGLPPYFIAHSYIIPHFYLICKRLFAGVGKIPSEEIGHKQGIL